MGEGPASFFPSFCCLFSPPAVLDRVATARRKRAAAEVDDETGSDTEWSEGFSSDDEAKRARRPPKKVRALARAARELDCTEAEASGSVSPDGHAAG